MTKDDEIRLAREFFDHVYDKVEDIDDVVYEIIDPEMEHDGLCDKINIETVKEVISLGFKHKYGVDWHVQGKKLGEIKSNDVCEVVVPRLERCPECGSDSAQFIHPAYDGGSYVRCANCRYSPQKETWAPTDAKAAVKWNRLERTKT